MTRRKRFGGGRLAKGKTQTAHKRARSPNLPVGRWIRPERRLAIYLRDAFRCQLCAADLSRALPRDITLDHWRPRAKGVDNSTGNLFTACHPCNSRRGGGPLPRGRGPVVKAATRRPMSGPLATARWCVEPGRFSSWAEAVFHAQIPYWPRERQIQVIIDDPTAYEETRRRRRQEQRAAIEKWFTEVIPGVPPLNPDNIITYRVKKEDVL